MADEEAKSERTKSRPDPPSRANSNQSEDQGYESRSRSASRRRRRQNQRQRAQASSKAQAGKAKAQSMTAVEEEEEEQDDEEPTEQDIRTAYSDKRNWLKNPQPQDTTETQPFEHIKPPSQSMDGPVTYSRMMRGEIPWRGPPPRQPLDSTQGTDAKTNGPDPMDQDGLKLRIELNLDIEIELKAHIHGDLTLALLA